MKHLWLSRSVAIVGCVLMFWSGCRRQRPVAPPPPPPTTEPAPLAPVPDVPLSDQPKVGQPMPAIVSEMLMTFEGRFGRPPTNYSELSRLKSEPPKK